MPVSPIVKVILADDHKLLREGFASMWKESTDIKLVADAENGEQLVRLTRLHQPDVVLTDIRMPEMNGMEATRILKAEFPAMPVITLTMFGDDNNIMAMLQAGVSGYVNKNAGKDEILEAIMVVVKGGRYYCKSTRPVISRLIATGQFDPKKNQVIETFTATEKRLIRYVCRGHKNREIAAAMKINLRTLEGYRSKLLVKMNVKNQAGVVSYAIVNGLYVPGE